MLDPEGRGEVLWTEMDQYDVVSAVAVEFAGMGVTVLDGVGALGAGRNRRKGHACMRFMDSHISIFIQELPALLAHAIVFWSTSNWNTQQWQISASEISMMKR